MAASSPDTSQRAFIEAPPSNARLLAPAGSGKTQSLLLRCNHLAALAKPSKPRTLVISFTRAAQQELASRLNEDSTFAAIRDQVEITTLNSWGYRRIKSVAQYPKLLTTKDEFHFTVKNALQSVWAAHDDVRRAIEGNPHQAPKKIMGLLDAFKSVGFDHRRHANLETFLRRLSELREQGLGPRLDQMRDDLAGLQVLRTRTTAQGQETAAGGDREVYSAFYRFWRDATEHLISSSTFTLEDQKYFAYLDEREKLESGKTLQGVARYEHVFVDEFQDINPLDLALIKAIVDRSRATLTIVGDDDQAIFEWRGATPEYILEPERHFGTPFKTFTLETNYRSPPNIVSHAQRLIAHNTRRVNKATHAHRTDRAEITVEVVGDLESAMDLVVSEVERCISAGESPSRVAIIGRKRSQLIPYQVFFASRGMPFCAAEDLQVFMSAAFERLMKLMVIKTRAGTKQLRTQVVEDLLDLCTLVKRYPLSKPNREDLRKYLSQTGSSTLIDAVEHLPAYTGTLKGSNGGTIARDMSEAIRAFLLAPGVSSTLTVLGTEFVGLQIDLGKAEDDIFFVDPPFFHLAEYALRYGDDYGAFLSDVETAKDQLAYVPPFDDESPGANKDLWKRPLHLMTALRSKGKEFDSVVLLDVNDGIWPSKHARTQLEREAERRVFYVAFTRARKRVKLIVSERLGEKPASVSPYIEELGLDE